MTGQETKKDRIREHLKSGKSITPREALDLYGSFRLGAVVFDLKKEGINIKTTITNYETSHFASYRIETEFDPSGQGVFI